MMEYIIVGGGISGLYSAYMLHKKFGIINMIVIEETGRLGGRIETLYTNGDYLELGAGGIINIQKNMQALVKELDLENNLMSGRGGRSLVIAESVSTSDYTNKDNNIVPTIYKIVDIVPIEKTDFYDIINILLDRLRDPIFYEMALTYNLYALLEKLYGFEKADQLMYQFGYHSDFYYQNSVEALDMFQREFSKNAKFQKFGNGMIQIIQKLAAYLQNNGITVRINCRCIDIAKNGNGYICFLGNGGKIEAKNIIFAIPKIQLLKINYFEKIHEKLMSVVHKPLIRIYVYFPLDNGKVWFENIKSVYTTRTLLNQIIPYNKKKGILMVYCDDLNAKTWYYFEKNNVLRRELMYHLTKLFSNINIPEPIKIYTSYHDSATHLWKPCVNPKQMYEEIVQPIRDENIFIVGEAYSLNQQWSEGAVQSVLHLMDRLEKNKNN